MRREAHPMFVRMSERCRAMPGAVEEHFLGETVFRVRGRVFAFLGRPDLPAVTVKPPRELVPRLLEEPSVRRARYVGRFGWVTVETRDEGTLRLALALVEESYRIAARGDPG